MPKRKTESTATDYRLTDLLSRIGDDVIRKFCAECGLTRDESRELYELLKDLKP